ncbi:MAG: hypothetical protein RIC89_05080 [Pseudomonadales bacterium]
MDVDAVSTIIKSFLRKHKQTTYQLSTNQSKALELAVTIGVTEHYRSNGYEVSVVNPPKNPSAFVVKTSTRGYPWNFSKILIARDSRLYEAHMNLMVSSAHDDGHYCVDVGVVKAGLVPDKQPAKPWKCAENDSLVTFAEVKKLVVYPMLLAQFVGIVHEILPSFIGGRLPYGFMSGDHLLPALASLGHFSGNATTIVNAYKKRNIRVAIATNFDIQIARVRRGDQRSPFAYNDI